VKEPLWQRRRNRRPPEEVGGEGASDRDERPAAPAPPRNPAEIRARLRDSTNTRLDEVTAASGVDDDGEADPERQAAYAAWAERMRGHKKAKLADITPEPDPDESASKSQPSVYWDASALFQPAPEEVTPDPTMMETRELLAILEVVDGADERAMQLAYRRLAKEHHPDRWQSAPDDVRAEHEERMALIAEAYSELKRRIG
jgi:hypothetical protein